MSVLNNPTTKAGIGLGNVDNTSDASKPVSTAQAALIATKSNVLIDGTHVNQLDISSTAVTPASIGAEPAGLAASTLTLLDGRYAAGSTTLHAARIFMNAGTQAVTGAAQIALPGKDYIGGTYVDNTTTSALKATVAGLYRISAIVRLEGTANGERALLLQVNGATARQVGGIYSSNVRLTVSDDVRLAANDVVTLGVVIAAASGINAVGYVSTDGCALTMTYIGSLSSDVIAPTTPGTPVATAGSGSNSLTWTASTDAVGVTGYNIYRSDAPTTILGTSVSGSYADTTAVPGTAYTYTVAGKDAAGNISAKSAASNSVTATAIDSSAWQIFVQDLFNSGSSSLTTAETGQTWVMPDGSWSIDTGKVKQSGGYMGNALINSAHTDMDVAVQIIYNGPAPTSPAIGVVANAADANNLLTFYSDNGTLKLAKVDGGTLTVLATGPTQSVSNGASNSWRIASVDNVITGYIDAVAKVTYTLSGAEATKYKALTMGGMRCYGWTAAQFDNFTIRSH